MVPLRFGSPEQFLALREFLREANYTEKGVCERLRLGAIQEFVRPRRGSPAVLEVDDRLQLLIQLFLAGGYVACKEIQSQVSAVALEAMKALGLLSSDPSNSERTYAPVALYPIQNLYIASDRWTHPDGSTFKFFDDIVFPAISPYTQQFLKIIPTEPCQRFLDLCAGTGIAALVAASYADRAWAIDITQRSSHFAEFNRLLNGASNVTALQGDLYRPAGDLAFDRIVAHPPYVPSLDSGEVYADGGEDGERVTRGIVEGLPRHLRPGGRLYCLTLGLDRAGEPFEQRLRRWLPDRGSEFDVSVLSGKYVNPSEFAFQSAASTRTGIAQVERWKDFFEKLQVTDLVHVTIVIQRKDSARPPFTVRRQKGPKSTCAETDWLMRWESAAASPEVVQCLLESRPLAVEGLELRVLHRLREGELVPSEFTFQTDYPFDTECKVQSWMAMLVARCDGKTTVHELFGTCVRDNLIHPDTPVEEFARLVGSLVSGGFLEVEGFRLPRHCSAAR